MAYHAPTHVTITTIGTDHNLSITGVARENALTGLDHTTDLNIAEVPVTTGSMHLVHYPTTTAAHDTHPPTNILGNTVTRTPHTSTATTDP